MGKKGKFGKVWEGPSTKTKESYSLKDSDDLVDPSSRSFVYDDVDDFHDDNDEEHLALAKRIVRKPKKDKEQVLGIGGDSSDSDDSAAEDSDASLLPDSDIVDERKERGLPDEREWGYKKRSYFGTDYSDEKIESNRHSEAGLEIAELEEETARRLQDRLAQELKHLQHDDLLEEEEEVEDEEMLVEEDVGGLSSKEKLRLLKKESPEFMPIVQDVKEKSEELLTVLIPLRRVSSSLPKVLKQYIDTKHSILMNYLVNVSAYMLVKCDGGASRHPVLGRLAQYRRLLQELEPCDEALGPGLRIAAQRLLDGEPLGFVEDEEVEEIEDGRKKRKQSKTLQLLSKKKIDKKRKILSSLLQQSDEEEEVEKKKKKKLKPKTLDSGLQSDDSSEDEVMEGVEDEEKDVRNTTSALGADERRGIGYTIQKNKGLMPTRKKEQRNPRVMYKIKYQNKLKKRKGQVRAVRTEVRRYDGELSGIKKNSVKSVRIK